MDYREVVEIIECTTAEEANKYLNKGWVLIKDPFLSRQKCYVVLDTKRGFQKIQSFEKIIKIYVLGKMKDE